MSVTGVLFWVVGGALASGLEKSSIRKVSDRNYSCKEIKSILNGLLSLGLVMTVAIILFGVVVITVWLVEVKAYGGLCVLFALAE